MEKLKSPLLTVPEAAGYLRVSIHTLRAWIWKGMVAHVKIGTRVFLRLADLDALIAAQTKSAFASLPTGHTKLLSVASDNGESCENELKYDGIKGIM